MKYVNRIRTRSKQLAELSNDQREFGLELYRRRYPIDARMACSAAIKAMDAVEAIVGSDRKKSIKLFTLFLGLDAATAQELYFQNDRLYGLLRLVKFDSFMKIIRMVASRGHSFHDFVSSMPRMHYDDDANEVVSFLNRILKYNQENFLRIWPYLNYKKVRGASNFREMDRHIRVIGASRVGITTSKVRPAFTYAKLIKSDRLMEFSKDAAIIATIGSETHCCFQKGGLAGPLVTAAMQSPLAGVIHGHIPFRWFAFSWEIVEIIPGEGVTKSLILDNVEAAGMVKLKHSHQIFDRLAKLPYSRVYCGTIRNDIEFPEGITDTSKKKPYHLIGYEKNFVNYGSYDDSKSLYTICERNPSTKAWVKQMNKGDHHRVAYLEKRVYSSPDPDFLKDVDVDRSPCYVLESDTHIFGYMTTRYLWFPKNDFGHGHEIKGQNAKDLWRAYDSEKGIDEEYELVLYLDDVVMCPGRAGMEALKLMIEHLADWARKNSIRKIAANTNRHSSAFGKRVERMGFEYIEQNAVGYESNLCDVVFGRNIRPSRPVTSLLKSYSEELG